MDTQTTVQKILVEADHRLRQAIADAATAGDLDGVDLARNAAGRLRQMINGIDATEKTVVNLSTSSPKESTSVGKAQIRKRSKRKSKYPQYQVRGNYLCRIGWSKKEQKEYEHKVAKEVFDVTLGAMDTLSHDHSGPITADQIIGKVNKLSSETIPNYQIYVVIGLLRDNDDITQVGRQGYDIPHKLREISATRWNRLAGGEK